ncbi:MAG: TagF domain-containing protein [Pseudomonadota bacterium]
MLGSLKSAPAWKWAAFGKHPVAGDYFNAGPDDPFFQAFSGWVENGYRQVCADRKNATDLYSWRFWAKAHQKDSLMFGVGRDSFDTIGRPYPLIIMGAGVLPDWQRHLPLLPFALEKTWIQMEYLATKRYIDFSQLENDIRRLPAPAGQWSELQKEARQRLDACQLIDDSRKEMIRQRVSDHAAEPEFLAPFDAAACLDAVTAAGIWHSALTEQNGTAPNATFLGGILNATFLAVFRRPLMVSDFIRLWSVGTKMP